MKNHANLGEYLWEKCSHYSSNIAFIETSREKEVARLTYLEWKNESRKLSSMISSFEVFKGDRCAIIMTNQSKWPLSGAAVLWLGATLVPIDYKLTPKEQVSILRHAEVKVLMIEWAIWYRWKKEKVKVPSDLKVIVSEVPSKESTDVTRFEEYTSFSMIETHHCKDVKSTDTACIVYSSGTGGVPKGCMLSHANYLAQIEVFSNLFPAHESDRFFSILPTNHAIDFMLGFLYMPLFGAGVVHQRSLRPEFLRWTMQNYGITHIAVVPLLLKALHGRIQEKIKELSWIKRKLTQILISINRTCTMKSPNYALSSKLLKPLHQGFGGKLRLMIAGGAFVEPSVAQYFYDIGIPVSIGYGLTEAGTALTVNDLNPFRADTVGKPVPGTELEVRNPNAEGVGEIWAKGPTVMKGYWKEPELSAEALDSQWLRTGDLGLFEKSGHLKLLGRSKNMIVTEGGKNVYPEDIESAFSNVKWSEEHCVFASNYIWPKKSLLNETLTLVMRSKDLERSEQILGDIQMSNHRLPDYKRIDRLVFWDREFPRTASMKIKRRDLAKEIQSEAVKILELG